MIATNEAGTSKMHIRKRGRSANTNDLSCPTSFMPTLGRTATRKV